VRAERQAAKRETSAQPPLPDVDEVKADPAGARAGRGVSAPRAPVPHKGKALPAPAGGPSERSDAEKPKPEGMGTPFGLAL
jgi:hypothetical protein